VKPKKCYQLENISHIFQLFKNHWYLRHCWLGDRNGIQTLKNILGILSWQLL